jgi:hypothetical protein
MEIPVDEDEPLYSKSFSVDEAVQDEVHTFFDEYGFVIFRDVITSNTCKAVIDDIWNLMEEATPGINRNDPDTWNQGFSSFGMPKNVKSSVICRPSILRLRQNESIVQCFSSILNSDDIICNHDRWLMHRPTKLSEHVYRSDWATKPNVHLDMNPAEFVDPTCVAEVQRRLDSLSYGERNNRAFISENNDVHQNFGQVVQGILNIGDLPSDTDGGGTILLPGSHRLFQEWAKTCPRKVVGPTQFHFGSLELAYAQRPTMRPGSLLIWDQRLIHGCTINMSDQFRYGVPIRFFYKNQLSKSRARDRAATVKRLIREAGFEREVTDMGKRVFFGIE